MENENKCYACKIEQGETTNPYGLIYSANFWSVDHSLGPIPSGTLIIRSKRHVYNFSDLTDEEAKEFSPLLHKVTQAMKAIIQPVRIYICCWADAFWIPAHLHFHLQPRRESDVEKFGYAGNGPHMQSQMAREKEFPDKDECQRISDKIKEYLFSIR